jgi:hypothetical protein
MATALKTVRSHIPASEREKMVEKFTAKVF